MVVLQASLMATEVNINTELGQVFDEVRGLLVTSFPELHMLEPAGEDDLGFNLLGTITSGWTYQEAGANQPATIQIVQNFDEEATFENLNAVRFLAFRPEGAATAMVFLAPAEGRDVPQIGMAQVWAFGVFATQDPYIPA